MIVTKKVKMDLNCKGVPLHIDAVQGDTNTRALELALYTQGKAWEIPPDATARMRYRKPDGTGGVYDTLPDGTQAGKIEGNTVTLVLVPQMLTAAGPVQIQVELLSGADSLATFAIQLDVERNVASGVVKSENYVNMQAWLLKNLDTAIEQTVEDGAFTPDISVGAVTTLHPGSAATAFFTGTGTKPVLNLGIPEGYSPQKGMDYWTEDDRSDMQAAVVDTLRPQIIEQLQHSPTFVQSTEECADTTKLYVLPDGYIYAYMKSSGALFANLANPAGADWAGDSRLNSSASVTTCAGAAVTNWIEAAAEDVIRVKGINILDSTAGYIAKDTVSGTQVSMKCASFTRDIVQDEEGITTYKIWYNNGVQTSTAANITRIRLSGMLTGAASDVVITKNEEIVYGERYSWQNTGRAYMAADYEGRIIALEGTTANNTAQIESISARVENMEGGNPTAQLPDYWLEYLPDKIAAIRAMQETYGKDCFSFPLLTDIHISVNLGKRSGLLAKVLMEACDMRYALCLGDVVTRGADKTAASMDASFSAAEALLLPIRDRLLQTQGNHDGSWGAEDLDDDGDVEGTEYYCHNFTPQKLHGLIYRKVGLVGEVHFDASGSGYYVDDVSNKVRYILLNSHNNTHSENEDGTARYNNMRVFRFCQSQYDLTVEALRTIPGDDWAVITASHAPLNDSYAAIFGGTAGDHVLMRRLLAAYKNKTAFSGSFAGTYGDDAVSVTADFSGAKGQYIAHFAGHSHTDSCGVYDGITVITTRCDGKEENDAALNEEKVPGTTTEQSFDVFTVNRATRRIVATKIGAGGSRTISY